MTIKTKFRLAIGVAIASAVVIAGVVLWAFVELEDIRRDETFGNAIRSDSVKLNLLTSELLLHRSDRVGQQWLSAQTSLSTRLGDTVGVEPRVAQFAREALRRTLVVGDLYDRLGETGAWDDSVEPSIDEATRFRFARILAENAAILSLTERIDEFLTEKRQDIVGSIFLYLSASSLAVLAVGAVVIFRLVPGLVNPILELRTVIQAIGGGDLEREVASRSEDEIGDVFREVDRMRGNLLSTQVKLTGLNRELSEAKSGLEARVRARTSELAAVNEELEMFAFSVSHDLRAPLRGMTGFSQALLEDYSDKLDDTGKDYLNRISAAGNRMGRLIDDLLKLSRVTRTEIKKGNVDMSELARGIADQLRRTEPDRSVEFDIQRDIVVVGDEVLLGTVLENLIGNAWKYSSKKDHARIEIGVENDGAVETIFVRDNGDGFDMAHVDKLFKPFQRLHREAEFEGTGVGLASVANIVRRHGGRVWAEGRPGEGATMRFTLGTQDDE